MMGMDLFEVSKQFVVFEACDFVRALFDKFSHALHTIVREFLLQQLHSRQVSHKFSYIFRPEVWNKMHYLLLSLLCAFLRQKRHFVVLPQKVAQLNHPQTPVNLNVPLQIAEVGASHYDLNLLLKIINCALRKLWFVFDLFQGVLQIAEQEKALLHVTCKVEDLKVLVDGLLEDDGLLAVEDVHDVLEVVVGLRAAEVWVVEQFFVEVDDLLHPDIDFLLVLCHQCRALQEERQVLQTQFLAFELL
jgi:hypothetical protein